MRTGPALEVSRVQSKVYNQPFGGKSRMAFKDGGVARLEVHTEVMRRNESFDKI